MDSGTLSFIFIIFFRGLIPFTILRWPLLGGFLAIIGDISDVFFFQAFGYGSFEEYFSYHQLDKLLDMWYLFFEFLIMLRWRDILAKKTGIVLFLWRFAGFLLFEFFGIRLAFFLAPNIFEFFYLGYLTLMKIDKDFKFTKKSLGVLLLVVGLPNVIKEYLMYFKFFWWIFK